MPQHSNENEYAKLLESTVKASYHHELQIRT